MLLDAHALSRLARHAGLLYLLIAPTQAVPQANGPSQTECQAKAARLLEMVRQREARGRHTVWDINEFYACVKPKGTFQNLANHLKLEDNNNANPIRSGGELAFYNALKREIARLKPGQTISQERMLDLGLDAVAAPNGTSNLQLAILTVHNVIRALARPLTWPPYPAPGDLQYPVFMDLWGRAGSGGPVLGDVLREARMANGQFKDREFTLRRMFDVRPGGVFPALEGVGNTEWNGGSHYYYWVGALAQSTIGSAGTMYGVIAEMRAKVSDGRGEQGRVEVSHHVCGSIFSSEARKVNASLLAPDPNRPGRCAVLPGTGQNLILQDIAYEVKDPNTREFVKGQTGRTPTSIWNVAGKAFQFHSDKDGFELRVEWSDMPAVMTALTPYRLRLNASLKGTRDADIAITPVMDMAAWKIGLENSTGSARRVGVNAYLLKLDGQPKPERPAIKDASMEVSITPVGRGARVEKGEVVGGSGVYTKGTPTPDDAWFVQLQINSWAQVTYTYVPEGSPLLAKH